MPRSHSDYTVAIICALEVDFTAVRAMLDQAHPRLPSPRGDNNVYALGDLHGHNVVVACLPQQDGKVSAATVATDLARTFTSILWRLLVGTGGGVPSDKHDIRLGDVVVSMSDGTHGGVVQYDLGRDTRAGFVLKSFLYPPPALLRSAVVSMRSDHRFRGGRVSEFMHDMLTRYPSLAEFARPQIVDPGHESSRPRASNDPEIHFGLIASGDTVLKSQARRDELVGCMGDDVLCVEMEAAGLLASAGCIVIRGVANYADERKNDDWQCYAAATAAACAKELLTYVDPPEASSSREGSLDGDASVGHKGDTSTVHGNDIVHSGPGNLPPGSITFWYLVDLLARVRFLTYSARDRAVLGGLFGHRSPSSSRRPSIH